MKRFCPACNAIVQRKLKDALTIWDNYCQKKPIASFQCPQCGTRIQPPRRYFVFCWTGLLLIQFGALTALIVDLLFRSFGKTHFSSLLWVVWTPFVLGFVIMMMGVMRLKYERAASEGYHGLTACERIVMFIFTAIILLWFIVLVLATVAGNAR